MALDWKNLPEDAQELKKLIKILLDENQLLKHKLFGRKTEKLTEEERRQLLLFNEAEQTAADTALEEAAEEAVAVAAHARKKRGRKPLPEDLPRVEVVHDLPEAAKRCGCGAQKSRIGEEVSEKLDIIPAKVQVIRHIRPKYACRSCEGVEDEGPTVALAPPPAEIIPKGIATAGLLAFVITGKFVDAMPFYRQEKQFARLGVELTRATMCGWALQVAERCRPMMDLLRAEILSGPLIQVDETRVQVLDEPGRAPQTDSYMWVFRGGPPGSPGLLYHYSPSRAGRVAADVLKGYQGYVQTDGYVGYDFLEAQPGVTHAGCWAHARRKFDELKKAVSGKAKAGSSKAGSADVALAYIRELYAVEHRAQTSGLTGEALVRARKEEAGAVLTQFKKWLEEKLPQTPPQGLLGKAIAYTLGQWGRLNAYLESPHLTPDNNRIENAIRPFVLGRKAWLFSGTPEGAWASATLYSLIETAKANGLEPYRYLRFLFSRLPSATSQDDYRALLPQSLSLGDILQSV